MATSLEKSKKLNGVIKPFHLSTNPEILVKIGPLASEPARLRRRPLKKNLKNKEKTSVKYIALPASLPSGLKKRARVPSSKREKYFGVTSGSSHKSQKILCKHCYI